MKASEKNKARSKPDVVAAFCRALWRHEHDVVAQLLLRVDPNGRDRFGYTPLKMAAGYGDVATVRVLCERGASLDQGCTHLSPLTLAARRGAPDIVEYLRAQGAKSSIVTHVHLGDKTAVAAALRENPALARTCDEEGTPVLHHAVEALATTIITALLRHGAAVSDRDARGETALHRIADLRRADPKAVAIAALLLERGADPNARNWDQVRPLHQAVRARNLAVAEVLLDHGADVNARDNRGSTPLRRAVVSTGASSTAGTADLMLPLTELLLRHGADPEERDKRGIAAAASAKSPALKALLARAGARAGAGKTRKAAAKKPRRRS